MTLWKEVLYPGLTVAVIVGSFENQRKAQLENKVSPSRSSFTAL